MLTIEAVTRDQIIRLLGHRGLRGLLSAHGRAFADDDDSDEEDPFSWGRSRRSAANRPPPVFEKVPSEAGRDLMTSGTFGANERPPDSIKRRKELASRLLRRELGLGSIGRQRARSGLLRQVRLTSGIVLWLPY
jgi:WD repeat-containing protein 23